MAIQVTDLSYVYNPGTPFEKEALSSLDFEIPDGQITAIMGHTGSGKSTLAQHFNGILMPTRGTCAVNGTVITKKTVNDIRRTVGMVFQYPEYQLFDETVLRDVAYGALVRGASQEDAEERARDAMRLVGLDPDEVGQRSPFDLSGGQKRRAAIAGVLVTNPSILVMDEPAAGLDPEGRRNVLNFVAGLNRDRGITVVIISHSVEDMAELADNIMVLKNGALHAYGTTAEVLGDAERLYDAGLDIPIANRMLRNLSVYYPDIDTSSYTVRGAVETIAKYAGRTASE